MRRDCCLSAVESVAERKGHVMDLHSCREDTKRPGKSSQTLQLHSRCRTSDADMVQMHSLMIKFDISEHLDTLFLRPHIKDIFQSIAARVGTGEPCCDWVSGI